MQPRLTRSSLRRSPPEKQGELAGARPPLFPHKTHPWAMEERVALHGHSAGATQPL